MDDQLVEWLRELLKLGGWGFVIFMLISGRFVPRWMFDRLDEQLKEEHRAREKAEELGDAALTAAKVAQQTLEAFKTVSERRSP